MESEENENNGVTDQVKHLQYVPSEYKFAIFKALRAMVKDGQLCHGTFTKVAREHKLSRATVTRIWTTGHKNLNIHGEDAPAYLLFPNNKIKCGRKPVHNRAVLQEIFRSTHHKKRSTTRSAAEILGISHRHFQRLVKDGVFRSATSRIKPKISPENMVKRVEFANSKIMPRPGNGTDPVIDYYDPQYDTIYLDEKWFYECPVKRRFYLCDDEEPPQQFRRSKSHLTKVMFISALARPWKTADPTAVETVEVSDATNWYFDGKIGVFPLVDYREQKRTTAVRERGELYPVCLSLTGHIYNEYIVNVILPVIALKCPPEMKQKRIKLIHDNATPHSKINMDEFNAKCIELGINVSINFQPPQSPDLNINDLSFFASIQSLYYKQTEVIIKNIETLIEAMDYTYEKYNCIKINRAFLTLFTNYNAILQTEGKNNYKIMHMSKESLERRGLLPTRIVVQRLPETELRDIIEIDPLDDPMDNFDLFSFADNNDILNETADNNDILNETVAAIGVGETVEIEEVGVQGVTTEINEGESEYDSENEKWPSEIAFL
jgi:hypothetical protein